MKILSDVEQAAVKDGVEALRYRAERLRGHSQFDENKPWSEDMAVQFERNAAILEGIAQKEM